MRQPQASARKRYQKELFPEKKGDGGCEKRETRAPRHLNSEDCGGAGGSVPSGKTGVQLNAVGEETEVRAVNAVRLFKDRLGFWRAGSPAFSRTLGNRGCVQRWLEPRTAEWTARRATRRKGGKRQGKPDPGDRQRAVQVKASSGAAGFPRNPEFALSRARRGPRNPCRCTGNGTRSWSRRRRAAPRQERRCVQSLKGSRRGRARRREGSPRAPSAGQRPAWAAPAVGDGVVMGGGAERPDGPSEPPPAPRAGTRAPDPPGEALWRGRAWESGAHGCPQPPP